jgi:hypothetical protein
MHITPLLPPSELDALPIIELPGLQGNPPTGYTVLQEILLPYVDIIHALWWVALCMTIICLLTRFIVKPLLKGESTTPAIPEVQKAHLGIVGCYKRLFSIQEIENDVLVRWFGGAVLLGFLATFRYWQFNVETTAQAARAGNFTCWPFFQHCTDWIFLNAFPQGYSQSNLYMALFGLMVLAAYGLATRRAVMAHFSIAMLLLAKGYFTLINFFYNGNYDYYQTAFTLVFLFLPHKRFFASLAVVMFYTLSTVAKIHPSWTLGLYFTSLAPGMPIFPNAIVPLMTNLVIFMEMIMAWFMFSHRVWLQRGVFAFFCLFHVYSGTLVGFHYPTIVMPALIVCFGALFRPFTHVPLDRKSIAGWSLMAMLWGLQIIPLTIAGDAKLTLEGNFYGLYMFEANHQCQMSISNNDGSIQMQRNGISARFRCDPWPFLFTAQQRYCKSPNPQKIHFRLNHSINGGPFYEIVNEDDLCALTYKPFSHNDWIKMPPEAKPVGRPVKNLFY